MTIAAGEYTIIDFNDIEIAFEEPLNPPLNQVWLDVSTVPNILKRWDGEKWVKASPTTAAEIGAETPEGAQDKVDAIEVGGRNYFSPTMLRNWAMSNKTIAEGESWKGFYIKVEPNETYSLSRTSLTNNRFRYYPLEQEPVVGTPLPVEYNHDTDLKIEGIIIPGNINYLFVYLTNQNDEIPNIKFEKGNKATDWTPAPEDAPTSLYELDPDAQESLDSHDAAISIIETGFVQLEDSIGTKVSQTDFDEFGNLINQQVSEVEQTQDSINMEFSQISENITNIDGDVTEIKTGIRFDEAGMHIGKSDSPLQMTLSNEQLGFLDNGLLVAYVNGQKLYITMAEILESLVVGNHKIEKYDENITLVRWVG